MAPNEELTNLLNSIGAIAEMLKIMYDRLLDQGFDDFQAMRLTIEFLKATMAK